MSSVICKIIQFYGLSLKLKGTQDLLIQTEPKRNNAFKKQKPHDLNPS